jgi:hypothetical protein
LIAIRFSADYAAFTAETEKYQLVVAGVSAGGATPISWWYA